MSGTTGPFTLDFAVNKGLGSSPGNIGVSMMAAKQDGGGASPQDSFLWLLEDDSGFFALEDDSGLFELEAGP